MDDIKNDIEKKPSEILELERVYGIVLDQLENYLNSTLNESFYFDNFYVLDANDFIIKLSIVGHNIKDISPLSGLTYLKSLDLGGNKLEDISGITCQQNLEFLSLSGNEITNLDFIKEFTNLKVLILNNNPITDISPVANLINLETLYAGNNGIKSLEFLSNLKNLTSMSIGENEITDIECLFYCNKLAIDLSNNCIKLVPKKVAEKYNFLDQALSVFHLLSNSGIDLSNNPLEFPPAAVIALGPETTKNYYEAAEQFGHAPLSEGRIIFVGDGSSGKSSVIEKILYNSFTLGREQTNGIKIEHLYLKHPNDKRQLSFHLWDFGGQEIQHAVHKFFLTEGCVYVVVLDNRKEEEPEYWLQQIESLGGKAPVLLVFNKQDENAAETADRKYLKEKYKNIVGFYNTSCKTGFGINDFKNSLEKEVVKLRTVSEQFPNNWLAVKKEIEQYTSGSQHYLTYEAYKEICKKNQLPAEEVQKLLLRYFNTIGAVTWFGEDTYLRFLHVLNPSWITQGVYKIITAKKTANLFGQLLISDFKELLQPVNKDDYSYDENHFGYILAMMKKFGLCYSPDDIRLLIPSAFGKVPKVEYSDFRGEQIRTYILQFKDYMPLALIHRFTAQKMPEALDNNYWYTGIVIKDSKSDTVAMVHADKEARRIYVRIKGESKLGVWEHIRRDLATIATSYAKIIYNELVALDEEDESTVNYEDLVSHIKANKQTYFHPRLQKDYNVGYLMGLFETKEGTLDKIKIGEISLQERGTPVPQNIPPFVLNILNNNNPVVNTQINTQINIDIHLVNELGSNVKGDSDYLLEALGESNKLLSDALVKVMQFADDVKSARNTGDVKEKGWGRKLKGILETLASTSDDLNKIKDGGEVLKSILNGIKNLAHHFNLDVVKSFFS